MNVQRQKWAVEIATSFILLGFITFAPFPAQADQDIPDVVLAGLNEYKANGPEAAIKAWIKGSAYETSVEALSQANLFRQVETMYGKFQGYQLIKNKEITKSSKVIYITMDFERGPVFASFLVFQGKEKRVIASFNFNTKPEAILPNCFLSQ